MNREKFDTWKALHTKNPKDPRASRILGELLEENDPLAIMYAARVCRSAWLPLDEDAKQAARIGLLLAFHKYEPARASFSTWAWHWVRHETQRHLAKHSLFTGRKTGVQLPATALQRLAKIRREEDREATAEELGVSEELYNAYRGGAWIESLDEYKRSSQDGEDFTGHNEVAATDNGPEDDARVRDALDKIAAYQDALPRAERALFTRWLASPKDDHKIISKSSIPSREARALLVKWRAEIYAAVLDWEK